MSGTATTDEQLIRNFPAWASTWLTLTDKAGGLVPFKLNPAQAVVEVAAGEQQAMGMPVRLRVLKARQQGLSTWATGRSLHRTATHHGHTALSLADKQDLPAQWLRRAQAWHGQLPLALRPHVKASNANELWFDKLGSRYYIGSAEGTTPGMGATIQTLHLSEIASWHDPDKVLADLLPAVPPGPSTMIVQESTGRSVGDWWYQRYFEAKRGADEYKAVFIPWYVMPEYRADGGEILGLSEEERALEAADCDKAQLAWRRATIRSDFHGDQALFANQFPATEDEAFLAGGASVFQPLAEHLANAKRTVRSPIWRGRILPDDNPQSFRLVGDDHGDLLKWSEPDERYHYVLGADCMWSLRDEADFDCAFVECLETGQVVAKIKGRFPLILWARLLAALGFHYNAAVLAPERNALSATTLLPTLLGLTDSWRYPNVWIRSDDVTLKGHRPQDYGWLTTDVTKGEAIAFCQTENLKGSFDWADGETVDQMAAYIRDDAGKLTAPAGAHDDDLMARLITAYVAHRQRPRTDLYREPERRAFKMDSFQDRMARHFGETETAEDE